MSKDREKVAILGGGISALTTAYELACQNRYDITVYQMGWRLGGKGASGRNRAVADRIEEHGLHIWFGFYENAFNLMRQCYEQVQKTDPVDGGTYTPFPSVQKAFTGQDSHVFYEHFDGKWLPWHITFPGDSRYFPGVPDAAGRVTEFPSLWEYILRFLDFATGHYDEHLRAALAERPPTHSPRPDWWHRLAGRVERDVEEGTHFLASEALHLALELARSLDDDPAAHESHHHGWLLHLLKVFKEWLNGEIDAAVRNHTDARRAWMLIDLSLTCMIGMLVDGVLKKGLDSINDRKFTDWLKEHGASADAAWSPPVQALHDAAFAYEGGDTDQPNMAAGVALRAALRIVFTYKGHILYKMNAGMGDTIFAPLYLVLRQMGVKFLFFHKVTGLELSPDGNQVQRVHVAQQVDLTGGRGPDEYDPLFAVDGLPCWPSEPFQEQIEQDISGVNLESNWADWTNVGHHTLHWGEDFDKIVLGISLAALPALCQPLIDASDDWKAMVGGLKTVKTQAVQLWFQRDDEELGYPVKGGIVACYDEPYASWADFDQLEGRESWPPEAHERSVFYSCNVLQDDGPVPPPSDHTYPDEQKIQAKRIARHLLETHSQGLFPKGSSADGSLDWDDLVDLKDGRGEARLEQQFFRVNIDPTERYVLSVADKHKVRLAPDASGFDNLYIVGTWTDNGFNLSSIEAAVMSGLKASRAMCGHPKRIVGEGDIFDD